MNRDGFSVIEVLIGLIILTFGVLALASSTGYISTQVRVADVRTERSTAYNAAAEELRAMDFDSVKDVTYANAHTISRYKVWWSVNSLHWALKNVTLYSEGPGFVGSRLSQVARDTLSIRIARPYP
jgi:Tfp pilus assembly protein PilV